MGGLTTDVARERVRSWAREQMAKPVVLVAPKSHRRWALTVADVGGRFDVDPAIADAAKVGRNVTQWDQLTRGTQAYAKSNEGVHIQPEFHCDAKLLDHQLNRIAKIVHTVAHPAKATYTPGVGVTVTTPEQPGIDLDKDATKTALLRNGSVWTPDGTFTPTPLVIRETEPPLRQDDLRRVDGLLGSFHTDYGSSSSNRRHNVEKAAGHIDGTLLAPGEVFSYNEVVGPRTTELGWQDAPTYQDGQVVPGPGGGVCQTSTTLYNAVLRAGLTVVMRSHHSMPVHYVEPGRDATVAYDDLDFRFRNSTDAPILVGATAHDGKLTFNLYGDSKASPGKIELTSSGHTPNSDGGFTVTTYRVLNAPDGTVDREKISTDTYAPPPSRRVDKPAHAKTAKSGVKKPTVAPVPSDPEQPAPSAPPAAPPSADAGTPPA